MSSEPVLIVGSVAFDTLHNPFGTFPRVLGGSGTYAALAASLFARSRLVGVVGDDYPEATLAGFRERGIDTEGVERVAGPSFHWEGRYSDDLASRETVKTELNCLGDFHPKLPDAYRQSRFVMLGNVAPALQMEALEQLNGAPALVVADTMNFWIDGARDDLGALLRRIDMLVLNEEEGQQLSGEKNIVKVGRALRGMGPKMVVVKRGEYGALLFDDQDDIFSAPAYPVDEVRDPTGAGDSFAGGLVAYLASCNALDPDQLRRAIVYGSAVASFCVEGVAVERLEAISRQHVDQRFERFRRLAHFERPEEVRASAT
jgi:sugar/nucleoside kinase (ribokinase family)